jgi:hypothetical protein
MRPFAFIVGVAALACGVLWFSLPGRAPQAAVPVPSGALCTHPEPAPLPAQLESCEAPAEREASPQVAAESAGPRPAELARRALAAAAAGLESADFRQADFEQHARALAAGMRAETQAQLVLLAADARLAARERVACAEILRHCAGRALPETALGSLREAWAARETEPALASAAVRALGAFGSADDRHALLDQSVAGSELALAGLSAARGDEAALELAVLAEQSTDPRRAEQALAALASIAASEDGGLTPRARAECAARLDKAFADARESRRRCALAALEPRLPAR